MPNLRNTKTHENLKAAFAGESQANRRYLYFAKQADVGAVRTSPASSATRRKARPAMPTGISSTSRRWAIRLPANRSAIPRRT